MEWNAQQYRFIQHYGAIRQTAFLVWRECTLVATRCVLLAFTARLTGLNGIWFVLIVGITIACLLAVPLFQFLAVRGASRSAAVHTNYASTPTVLEQ